MGREGPEKGAPSYSGSRLAPMTWQLLKGAEGNGDRRAKATTGNAYLPLLAGRARNEAALNFGLCVWVREKIYIQRLYPQHTKKYAKFPAK